MRWTNATSRDELWRAETENEQSASEKLCQLKVENGFRHDRIKCPVACKYMWHVRRFEMCESDIQHVLCVFRVRRVQLERGTIYRLNDVNLSEDCRNVEKQAKKCDLRDVLIVAEQIADHFRSDCLLSAYSFSVFGWQK